jgi:hypothetical protein
MKNVTPYNMIYGDQIRQIMTTLDHWYIYSIIYLGLIRIEIWSSHDDWIW